MSYVFLRFSSWIIADDFGDASFFLDDFCHLIIRGLENLEPSFLRSYHVICCRGEGRRIYFECNAFVSIFLNNSVVSVSIVKQFPVAHLAFSD